MEEQASILLLALFPAVVVLLVAVTVGLGASKDKNLESPDGKVPNGLRTARVYRVIDGDTVIVSTNWRKVTIRLDAIDCPENGQYWGDTAKFGLIKLIGGRNIRLEEHGLDKYGRTLATVYVAKRGSSEWMNVNLQMVTLGHAWVSRNLYSHLPPERQVELNRLEEWARSRGVGLWRATNPVPPWKWRGIHNAGNP